MVQKVEKIVQLPMNMSPTLVCVNRDGIILLSMQVKNTALGCKQHEL